MSVKYSESEFLKDYEMKKKAKHKLRFFNVDKQTNQFENLLSFKGFTGIETVDWEIPLLEIIHDNR